MKVKINVSPKNALKLFIAITYNKKNKSYIGRNKFGSNIKSSLYA